MGYLSEQGVEDYAIVNANMDARRSGSAWGQSNFSQAAKAIINNHPGNGFPYAKQITKNSALFTDK